MPPNKIRQIVISAVVLCLLVISFIFTQKNIAPSQVEFANTTMGTTYTVKYIVHPETGRLPDTGQVSKDIQKRLDTINQLMSTYIPDSELSRLNTHKEKTPFQVSEDTYRVFQMAQQISKMTDGAFDITVGPIVNAYGFGPAPKQSQPPDDEMLAVLRQRVGYQMIKINSETKTISKSRPDLYCDLSAIAKGYAVDEIAELLENRGIQDYMVEIGGETRVKGKNVKGTPWRIAIEKPVIQKRFIQRVIDMTDAAIATSGDYRNFHMNGDTLLSHTIDPRTGKPVTHNLASVSVIDTSCMRADALATAFMVLGAKQGYNLAEENGIAALFMTRQPDGKITEKATTAFEKMTNKN